jgi:hypothetical protein
MIVAMRDNSSVPVRRTASGIEWWVPLALATGGIVIAVVFWAVVLNLEHSAGWGFDFRAYYEAAQRLVATGTPYQPETLNAPFRPGPAGLYLYTPMPALLVVPLTWLGPQAATMSWFLLRVGLLAATCGLMPVPRWVKLSIFAVAAISAEFLYDLNLGNVSLIVTFFAVVAWRWLDRPLSGLALAASATVRPAMGAIWVWWLVRRKWRAAIATVAGLLAIVLVSLPFVGLGPWLQYAQVLRNVSDVLGVQRNLDFGSTALSLGVSPEASNLFLIGGYVVALGAIVFSLRRDREISYVVTLMATLLLTPLLWDHYLTSLIVPAALVAARGRRLGIVLPLLGWLPLVLLPVVVVVGMLLPFSLADRGERSLRLSRDEAEPVADADSSLRETASA